MKVVLCSVPMMDLNSVTGVVEPIGQDYPPRSPSLAIYLLAAVLREHDYEFAVIDLVAEQTNRIDNHLSTLQDADLIAISGNSLNWATVLSVIGQIRAAEITAPLVVGGVHPTMFTDYVLKGYPKGSIDFVIRYEGEKALLMLCRALEGQLDYADIPNLSWRTQAGEVVHNPNGPTLTVEELVSLPLPAFDMVPREKYFSLAVQSSRGCPYNCSFCSTSFRRSYRGLPPTAFVDMLEEVLSLSVNRVQYPDWLQVVDDEWSMDHKRALAVLREMNRRGMSLKFNFDSRANDFLFDEEYVSLVAPYTGGFLVGAECGYDEGLRRIGKGTTVEKLEACARLLSKYGIAQCAEFSFILGLPWEGKDEVLKTVEFASHLVFEYGVTVLMQFYCQIPGSLLWDQTWQQGEVTAAMYNEFGFFRNLYLFKTGVQLSPDEIWEVMDAIRTVHSLICFTGRPQHSMRYRNPASVEINFPPLTLRSEESSSTPLIWNREARNKAVAGARN